MMQCNCDENMAQNCHLGHFDGDEIIGYIAPCGQPHYCRMAGEIMPDCGSYYCRQHNAEGLPFDGNVTAYQLRTEIAKRGRGEPYDAEMVAEIMDFMAYARCHDDGKADLLREARQELHSKLGDLPEYALDYMAREQLLSRHRFDQILRLAELLHRDCPDNRAWHQQSSRGMFCCQSCYTDADGNAYHCPLEAQLKREEAEGRFPNWPPLGGWGRDCDRDE